LAAPILVELYWLCDSWLCSLFGGMDATSHTFQAGHASITERFEEWKEKGRKVTVCVDVFFAHAGFLCSDVPPLGKARMNIAACMCGPFQL
jgi:hypothetical protein